MAISLTFMSVVIQKPGYYGPWFICVCCEETECKLNNKYSACEDCRELWSLSLDEEDVSGRVEEATGLTTEIL